MRCASSTRPVPSAVRSPQFGRILAATLLIVSFVFVAAAVAAEKKPLPAQPVNINKATSEELQTLPGVGPEIAKAILRHRAKNGPFRRVEELLVIKGIGRAKLKAMKPYVRVD